MSHFHKIDESQNGIKGSSLNQKLTDNQEQVDDRGKVKAQLPLEHLFGFCKTFKKNTKKLSFHLNLKTADLQELIYTTLGGNINIELRRLYLYRAVFIPDPVTQALFRESIKIV